jgi:hypothetical protein
MLRVSHKRSAGVRSQASGGGLSGWFDGPDLADVRRYVALRRWQRADDLRDEPAADLLSPPLGLEHLDRLTRLVPGSVELHVRRHLARSDRSRRRSGHEIGERHVSTTSDLVRYQAGRVDPRFFFACFFVTKRPVSASRYRRTVAVEVSFFLRFLFFLATRASAVEWVRWVSVSP